MSAGAPETAPAGPEETRVELARRLFREYYVSCFWHLRPDLEITEATVPLVVKGLRNHGGRRGFLASARLTLPRTSPSYAANAISK